jgi:hypothetical protein
MTIPPPKDKALTKDTTPKTKVDVDRVILEYESYIDQRVRTRTNAGATPPFEIKIDRETPGVGTHFSDLTQEDFQMIKQRIETNYKESGWGDVCCAECEGGFITRLLTVENVLEEDAMKRQQSGRRRGFITSLKKMMHLQK